MYRLPCAEDQNLPEYALPHLVYMLAYHEDFEDSTEALEMFSQYVAQSSYRTVY